MVNHKQFSQEITKTAVMAKFFNAFALLSHAVYAC